MGEYGILVVETEPQCCEHADAGYYQIIGEVASPREAVELARQYRQIAGPDNDDTIPPDHFYVWRRAETGRYSIREDVAA